MSEIKPIITEEQAEQIRQAMAEAFRPVAEAVDAMAEAFTRVAQEVGKVVKRAAHPEG